MRVHKFSICLISATLLALLYVHQQIQLVKISYEIESNEKEIVTLLDQHKTLMYNNTKLKSPVDLERNFLADKEEFGISQQWKVVEVMVPKVNKEPVIMAKARNSLAIFNIFGKPKEVFANTIK